MNWQKMLLLILSLGLAYSLQAQSPFLSEKGRHTLFFYPWHVSYNNFLGLKKFSPLPGLAYNYQLEKNWYLQAKLFYRQMDDIIRRLSVQKSIREEKNIKLGMQYVGGKKWMRLILSSSVYLENRKVIITENLNPIRIERYRTENEIGLDFGFGFGFQITKQVLFTFSSAFRHGEIARTEPSVLSYYKGQFNLVESLGFGYTF